ncbi:MAG: Hercynine oxygenase [Calditrichaeota bacterium]|nr:Hercynine oxygenase [Calditrichota bacterium]
MRTLRWIIVLSLLAALIGGCGGGCQCEKEEEEAAPEVAPKPEPAPEPEVIEPDTTEVVTEKPEPAPAPKPKPKPEPRPEPKPRPKPEKPAPEPAPKPKPEPEPVPEPEPAPKPVPKPEPEPAPEPKRTHEIEIVEGPFGMEFARIPAGEFMIGSPPGEPGRDPDEGPRREIEIDEFWLCTAEVTLRQWKTVMGRLPQRWREGGAPPKWTLDEPVRYVNWDEAKQFLDVLSERTGHAYRLPNEAEWEYACRAWEDTPFWVGELETDLRNVDLVGPYGVLMEAKTTGRYNPFGLYDMHGNVSEWTEDDYVDTYRDLPRNGNAYESNPGHGMKVARGGNFLASPDSSRAAAREPISSGTRWSTVGFRVATDTME